MLSAKKIMEMAIDVDASGAHKGYFLLSPPVALMYLPIKKVVQVVAVDIEGEHSNTARVSELDYWYPAGDFEIPSDAFMIWSCPNLECEGSKIGSDCDQFCRKCGMALKQVLSKAADNTFCLECKASVFPTDKFCGACGVALPAKKGE